MAIQGDAVEGSRVCMATGCQELRCVSWGLSAMASGGVGQWETEPGMFATWGHGGYSSILKSEGFQIWKSGGGTRPRARGWAPGQKTLFKPCILSLLIFQNVL